MNAVAAITRANAISVFLNIWNSLTRRQLHDHKGFSLRFQPDLRRNARDNPIRLQPRMFPGALWLQSSVEILPGTWVFRELILIRFRLAVDKRCTTAAGAQKRGALIDLAL
jgi:hypothetical protein